MTPKSLLWLWDIVGHSTFELGLKYQCKYSLTKHINMVRNLSVFMVEKKSKLQSGQGKAHHYGANVSVLGGMKLPDQGPRNREARCGQC